MRCLWTLLTALALVIVPLAAGEDDKSGICVGGLQVVACVPPDRA